MIELQEEKITFKPLTESYLPLLHQWFQIDHIKKWYARGETYSLEMIKEKYLPRIKASDKIPSYIILLDDKPIGYIQFYHLDAPYYPEGLTDFSHPLFKIHPPEEIAGLDVFIADINYLGRGYGKKLILHFIANIIPPKFNTILVDPAKNNINALSAFYKMGFKEFITTDTQHILILTR